MPEQAVHLAAFGGDVEMCLTFAERFAAEKRVARLHCVFPPSATEIQAALSKRGFALDASDYIVMQVKV